MWYARFCGNTEPCIHTIMLKRRAGSPGYSSQIWDNKLFGGMIGDGCGQDGIIDCCTNDESAIAQGALSCNACPECEENKRYDLETSCYEGCWFRSGNYRSTFRSIMSSRIGSQEFGKLNEKILCHQMELLTGEAGGICNRLQPLFQ